MKRNTLLPALLGVASCAVLAGCASMAPEPGKVFDTDWEKVRIVEKYHRQRGSMVVWMNYPTRAVQAEQPDSTQRVP